MNSAPDTTSNLILITTDAVGKRIDCILSEISAVKYLVGMSTETEQGRRMRSGRNCRKGMRTKSYNAKTMDSEQKTG